MVMGFLPAITLPSFPPSVPVVCVWAWQKSSDTVCSDEGWPASPIAQCSWRLHDKVQIISRMLKNPTPLINKYFQLQRFVMTGVFLHLTSRTTSQLQQVGVLQACQHPGCDSCCWNANICSFKSYFWTFESRAGSVIIGLDRGFKLHTWTEVLQPCLRFCIKIKIILQYTDNTGGSHRVIVAVLIIMVHTR